MAVPGPAPAGGASLVTLVDTVINNTNANLKNTDTAPDGEPGIALNPLNPNEIVISAFSSSWTNGAAALWHSVDGGQTWTKTHSIPAPPDVGGTAGCPCDQTFDFGTDGILYGTLLTDTPSGIYTGATSDPANASAWKWWLSAGVAQRTDVSSDPDQPWLLTIGQTVFVAYDDFSISPTGMRVAVSPNGVPPTFATDQFTGSTAGAINPGHRLAKDVTNGFIYDLYQNCISTCNDTTDPKQIQYILNRSTDFGLTWGLNGSSTGIIVATAHSTQPTPKFGTVNALLGGVLHGAVDRSTGDVFYVYGNRDTSGNNRLAIRRIKDIGRAGVTIGPESFVVSGAVEAALPSVAVTDQGDIGVLYYTYDGIASGFPQFSTWLAVSTDHGTTFKSQKLVSFLSPAVDNGDVRQRVLGDYIQLKSMGNCFYGAFTANGAAFGRSVANTDPVFMKACMPSSPAVASHDFNGDSKSDVMWMSSGGQLATWLMNGTAIQTSSGVAGIGGGWQMVKAPAATADFDGDGKSDVLWRHTDGTVAIWLMNGATVSSSASLGVVDPSWQIAGIGDFNGDGRADILWRHTSGALAVWFMNGTTVASSSAIGSIDPNWQVSAIDDFNGDGKSDIVLRHAISNDLTIWLMNGANIASGVALGVIPPNWQIVGTGDFNADGDADILLRHSSGAIAMWFMNGAVISSGASVGSVDPVWAITSTGDYDGNGTSDILWTSTGGDVALWLMNGATVSSAQVIGAVSSTWHVAE